MTQLNDINYINTIINLQSFRQASNNCVNVWTLISQSWVEQKFEFLSIIKVKIHNYILSLKQNYWNQFRIVRGILFDVLSVNTFVPTKNSFNNLQRYCQ